MRRPHSYAKRVPSRRHCEFAKKGPLHMHDAWCRAARGARGVEVVLEVVSRSRCVEVLEVVLEVVHDVTFVWGKSARAWCVEGWLRIEREREREREREKKRVQARGGGASALRYRPCCSWRSREYSRGRRSTHIYGSYIRQNKHSMRKNFVCVAKKVGIT